MSTPVHQQQQQKTEKRMSKQSNVTVKKMNNIRTANIFEASNGSKQRRQKKNCRKSLRLLFGKIVRNFVSLFPMKINVKPISSQYKW